MGCISFNSSCVIVSKISHKEKDANLRKTVKSLFIVRFLFSYITERKKFKLIMYNKKFQNKFKIGIEDYKKESGKLYNRRKKWKWN